jgi:HK97 family phage major capsid protein
VTTQPAISTEEAEATDVELSPVGDEKVVVVDDPTETRAEWDAAYINALPDSAFAVVLPGGEKDDEGKTVPRSLRKLPHHDTAGTVDLPHLRNALSREPQADMPESAHERARAHLATHAEAEEVGETRVAQLDVDVAVRSVSKRELEVRLLPWDTTIETLQGPEEFARGSIAGTPDDGVLLMGLEHEAHIGLGQSGNAVLTRRPAGRSLRVWEAPDGPHVLFRVARTQSGDEILALAEDRVVRGVSLEFNEVPGGTSVVNRNGRRVRVHKRVALTGASMTYRPAYGEQAAVLAVRSQEATPVTEATEAPVAGAVSEPEDRIAAAIEAAFSKVEARAAAQEEVHTRFLERLESLEEKTRGDIVIPNPGPEKDPVINKGEWIQMVVRMMSGERIPDVQMRALDDVITTDNAGVVPPAYLTELIGVIDKTRPFLSTTRRLPTPSSGMKLTVPVITQRPTVAVQSPEKTEVSSQKTLIGTEDFNAITIAGAGDLSIQIIKRSSPDFLNLWVDLLAEAYAIESEDQAILSLLNSMGGVGSATALNPEDLNLGAAFIAAFDAIRRPPDTIWLSTQAVGEFIDAKASTTNQPLYPGLAASATAAGGITGVVSGLRPVHVPSLDAHGAYAIVGPSSGFAWAEDGTYTLQVDVPAKAGRDVALVGILWPAPWYPAAFTAYNVAS